MYNCINGCGYTNSHRGAMNIHEKIHCKNLKIITDMQHDLCNHNFRLLKDSDRLEAGAIKVGYKIICLKCEEVR